MPHKCTAPAWEDEFYGLPLESVWDSGASVWDLGFSVWDFLAANPWVEDCWE